MGDHSCLRGEAPAPPARTRPERRPPPWAGSRPRIQLCIGLDQPLVLRSRRLEAVRSFPVVDMDFRPGRGQEHPPVIAMGAAEPLQHGFARRVLERGGRIDQASVEEQPAFPVRSAASRSASAMATARRAKAAGSTQGKAAPSPARSSRTIRRPGSSTTAWPRRASSASRVDLPPPEQPEITTKRSMFQRLGKVGGQYGDITGTRSHGGAPDRFAPSPV
jgi:hypothetical protein